MKNKLIMFWAIVVIVIASIITICVKPTKLGLDLVGGSRLVLEAQTTDTIAQITPDMMASLQFAIENRVNKLEFGRQCRLTMRHEMRRLNEIVSRPVASLRSAYGIRQT